MESSPLLKQLGLTYTQYILFLVLWEKDGLTVGEICKRLMLDSGTLSPLLKKLRDQGYIIKQQSMTDERSFEVHDVSEISETPGEYLLRRFCNEAERKRYWPNKHKSYERFLATNDNTTLNRRICCIVGIDANNAEAWLRSVTEYLENRDSRKAA